MRKLFVALLCFSIFTSLLIAVGFDGKAVRALNNVGPNDGNIIRLQGVITTDDPNKSSRAIYDLREEAHINFNLGLKTNQQPDGLSFHFLTDAEPSADSPKGVSILYSNNFFIIVGSGIEELPVAFTGFDNPGRHYDIFLLELSYEHDDEFGYVSFSIDGKKIFDGVQTDAVISHYFILENNSLK